MLIWCWFDAVTQVLIFSTGILQIPYIMCSLEADKDVHMANMIWVSPELEKCIKDLVCVCVFYLCFPWWGTLAVAKHCTERSFLPCGKVDGGSERQRKRRAWERELGNGRKRNIKMFGHVDCMCLKAWRDDSEHLNSAKIQLVYRECYLCIW